jgi:putative peptidoglycan lipid II flippase
MKLSISLAVLTVIRLAVSTLTQLFVLTQLGVGRETDALVAGSLLPQLAITLVAGSLQQVFVPLFAAEDRQSLQRDAWTAFVVLLALAGAVTVVLIASADLWVPLLSPGFDAPGKALLIELTRIQLAGMVFSVPFAVLWSLRCARGQLFTTEMVMGISVAITSAMVLVGVPRFGVQVAALATTLRPMLDVLILAASLGAWRGWARGSHLLRTAWKRVRYLFLGSAYYGTEPFVNQFLTSFAPPGSLSVLFTGQQIYSILSQVVSKAVAAPMLPMLAEQANHENWPAFHAIYRKRLGAVTAMALAVVAGVLVLGQTVLGVLAGRGNFTQADVQVLWLVMIALSGVCVGGFMGQITLNSLHAMGDTRTPTQLGIVTYTVYLPIKVAAFLMGGVLGLAVAASAFFIVNMLGQWYFLNRAMRRQSAARSLQHGAH